MEPDNQTTLAEWAILEIFGHQRFAGFVQTQHFGQTTMFRLDVPELVAETITTQKPMYLSGYGTVPAGTELSRPALAGYSKLFGAGAIYCLTPCTEQTARETLREMQPRPLVPLNLSPTPALPEPTQRAEQDAERQWSADEDEDEELTDDEDPDEDESPLDDARPED